MSLSFKTIYIHIYTISNNTEIFTLARSGIPKKTTVRHTHKRNFTAHTTVLSRTFGTAKLEVFKYLRAHSPKNTGGYFIFSTTASAAWSLRITGTRTHTHTISPNKRTTKLHTKYTKNTHTLPPQTPARLYLCVEVHICATWWFGVGFFLCGKSHPRKHFLLKFRRSVSRELPFSMAIR